MGSEVPRSNPKIWFHRRTKKQDEPRQQEKTSKPKEKETTQIDYRSIKNNNKNDVAIITNETNQEKHEANNNDARTKQMEYKVRWNQKIAITTIKPGKKPNFNLSRPTFFKPVLNRVLVVRLSNTVGINR